MKDDNPPFYGATFRNDNSYDENKILKHSPGEYCLTPNARNRALLVDDEPTIVLTLSLILKSKGFDVHTASSAKEAKILLGARQFDVVMTDLSMEAPLSGYDVVETANLQTVKPVTIVVSGYHDLLEAWQRHGANAAFAKPTDAGELLKTIQHLLQTR